MILLLIDAAGRNTYIIIIYIYIYIYIYQIYIIGVMGHGLFVMTDLYNDNILYIYI